jgi:hypothetical protein
MKRNCVMQVHIRDDVLLMRLVKQVTLDWTSNEYIITVRK